MKLRNVMVQLCGLALVLTGCGGGLPGVGGGKSNVKQAQSLNAELEHGYSSTAEGLASLEKKAGDLTAIPEDVDTSKLEMDKVKAALLAAFKAPVDKAKASERAAMQLRLATATKSKDAAVAETLAVPTKAEQELEEYLKTASPEAQKFVKAKLTLVHELRDQLLGVLPTQVELVTKKAGETKAKMAAFVKSAEAATKLPTAGDKTKKDLVTIKGERTKADELATKITTEFEGYPDRMKTVTEKITTDLTAFGGAAASEVTE